MRNPLDGSEDYLVSDELFAFNGDEMVDFWKELMSQNSVKTLKDVIRNLEDNSEVVDATTVQ